VDAKGWLGCQLGVFWVAAIAMKHGCLCPKTMTERTTNAEAGYCFAPIIRGRSRSQMFHVKPFAHGF
jgi:hypothetical protein